MIFFQKIDHPDSYRKLIDCQQHGVVFSIILNLIFVSLLTSCTKPEFEQNTESGKLPRKVLPRERYERAEKLLENNALALMSNIEITPYWIGDTSYFWYRREKGDGTEFILVDAEKGIKAPAFDHKAIAKQLTEIFEKEFNQNELPIKSIQFSSSRDTMEFYVNSDLISCDITVYSCQKSSLTIGLEEFDFTEANAASLSPDKRWVAFLREHNLWVRSTVDGSERPLTTDGTASDGYAHTWTLLGNIQNIYGYSLPPDILWSPDSTKILTIKVNSEGIRRASIVRYAPPDGARAPKTVFYDYFLPQDDNNYNSRYVVIDVESGQSALLNGWPGRVPDYYSPMGSGYAWWPEDDRIYFLHEERYRKRLSLNRVNIATQEVMEIFAETSDTYINPHLGNYSTLRAEVKVLPGSKEFIWFSERSGYANLYLYNLENGALKNPITPGNYVVHGIIHVDEDNRRLYFVAGGKEKNRDPYLGHLYGVNFDGTDLKLLTPEDADHKLLPRYSYYRAQALQQIVPDATRAGPAPASFSADGKYFIETVAWLDKPSKSLLKRADGSLVTVLEEADISKLKQAGWKPGKSFRVKAADHTTDLYGVLFFPSDFDPKHTYPIIDAIYAGPTSKHTPKTIRESFIPGSGSYHYQAMAELGFIVLVMDGRGTSYRSKFFHDYLYAKLESAGLEDHVFALEQLAKKFDFIDLDKVGIYGHSYGGYAATRAIMAYPEVYDVAIASAPMMSMDLDGAPFGDWQNGPFTDAQYEAQHNRTLAKSAKIKGKYFVLHGDIDTGTPMWGTIQVLDVLMKKNQDFDMLIFPNEDHGSIADNPYHIKRVFDYFVRHLLGLEPPTYGFLNPES